MSVIARAIPGWVRRECPFRQCWWYGPRRCRRVLAGCTDSNIDSVHASSLTSVNFQRSIRDRAARSWSAQPAEVIVAEEVAGSTVHIAGNMLESTYYRHCGHFNVAERNCWREVSPLHQAVSMRERLNAAIGDVENGEGSDFQPSPQSSLANGT